MLLELCMHILKQATRPCAFVCLNLKTNLLYLRKKILNNLLIADIFK